MNIHTPLGEKVVFVRRYTRRRYRRIEKVRAHRRRRPVRRLPKGTRK